MTAHCFQRAGQKKHPEKVEELISPISLLSTSGSTVTIIGKVIRYMTYRRLGTGFQPHKTTYKLQAPQYSILGLSYESHVDEACTANQWTFFANNGIRLVKVLQVS